MNRMVETRAVQQVLEVTSSKEAIRQAKKLGAVFTETSGGLLWDIETFPQGMQIALLSDGVASRKWPDPQEIILTSEKARKAALARTSLITSWYEHKERGMSLKEFIDLYNAGAVARGCMHLLGKITAPTFYRWASSFEKGGADALIPKYGRNKNGAGSVALTPMEQEIAKAYYLHPNKWSPAKVHRELARCYGTKASPQTVARYLNSLPRSIRVYYREGKTKFEAKVLPYICGDPERFASMDMVVSDHHNWDFLVRKGDKIFRPWITVFQDHRSRKILSWSHSLYPSSESIAEGLYMLTVKFGAPETLHIDNGKDYRGSYLNGKNVWVSIENEGMNERVQAEIQGVFGALGIKVIFALPYHGQSKPIERHFGTFAQDFAKEFETYVGSNTVTRPEEAALYYRRIGKQDKKEVVYDWEVYMLAWEAYIEQWNATHRHSGKGMDGKTPNEVFFANWKRKRNVSPEYLEIAFASTESRKVMRNGITIDGTVYWGNELRRHIGAQVLVKRSFSSMTRAMVFDIDGRFLCYAEADYFAETGDLAEDNRRVNDARKLYKDDIKLFESSMIEPEEGKRGAVDFALAHKGVYDGHPEPGELEIEQVVNGDFELPAPYTSQAPRLEVVDSPQKPHRKLRSSLEESLE